MRSTKASGKDFQTEREGEDKLGQTFCKEQKHQNCVCIAMREQTMFCPGGLWGSEGETNL